MSFDPAGRPSQYTLRSVVRTFVASALLLCLPLSTAFAQVRIPASWDRNVDILTAGYRVFIGTAPDQPQTVIDTGQATSTVLTLPVGAIYYMTVRAYSLFGVVGPASAASIIDLAAAPGPPSDTSALTFGSTAIVSWSPPETGGAPLNYRLSVGTGPGASNLVHDLPVGNVLAISGRVPPGVYFARVRGANLVGLGDVSSEVRFEVAPTPRPSQPVELSAEWEGTRAHLTWSRPTDAWGDEIPNYYRIEAGSAPGASNLASFSVGNTTAFSVDVPPGTYYVRVRGIGAGGVSTPSNEIVLHGRGAPGPARGLTATVAGGSVTLTWEPPDGDPSAATGYLIEAGSAPGSSNLAAVSVGSTPRFSTALPAGTYFVRVRAVNARGRSAPSNEVEIRR